jgi:adenosine deaminase
MQADRRFFLAGLCAATLPLVAPGRAWAAPKDDMARFIAALPKAEYHVHLEGTLEAEMKFALAQRNGVTLPYADVAAMKRSYVYHDLPSFLKIYYEGMSVLLKEQDFYDLCYAYLAKAHASNVLYAEMFFDPQQHIDRGLPIADVIGGITRARAAAKADMGIESQLILCFMRDMTAANAMAALDAALPYKDKLIGVGLDSDEKDNPPAKFAAHFAKARAAGLHVTAHCDVNQQGSLEHIRQALVDIGVERIDHGGNILQSPELMALARKKGIAFTVCPTFSGAILVDGKPVDVVRGMLEQGLKVTLNSDDPAYMGSAYLTDVIVAAQARSSLTRTELVGMSRNAFAAAWIAPERKAGFQAKLDAFAAQWAVS